MPADEIVSTPGLVSDGTDADVPGSHVPVSVSVQAARPAPDVPPALEGTNSPWTRQSECERVEDRDEITHCSKDQTV